VGELPRLEACFAAVENWKRGSAPELPRRQRVAAGDLWVLVSIRVEMAAQTMCCSPGLFLLTMCWRPQRWRGASGEPRE